MPFTSPILMFVPSKSKELQLVRVQRERRTQSEGRKEELQVCQTCYKVWGKNKKEENISEAAADGPGDE